ncbi:MAG: hypothetical protein AAGA35_00980 [Patescibacteria group bacterium]
MTEAFFVRQLEKQFIKDGFYTNREVGVGYGIADLVLFKPNRGKVLKRLGHNQHTRLLSENYFKILDKIADYEHTDVPTHISEIEAQISMSRGTLRYSVIPRLKKAGYIREVEKSYYLKINGWLPISKELIAIEAKLHDWKKGLQQAARYKSFAHRSYLAVPSKIIKNIPVSEVRKYGVGLIGFDVDTEAKYYPVAAKRITPFNLNKRDYASEYFWSASLKKDVQSLR